MMSTEIGVARHRTQSISGPAIPVQQLAERARARAVSAAASVSRLAAATGARCRLETRRLRYPQPFSMGSKVEGAIEADAQQFAGASDW